MLRRIPKSPQSAIFFTHCGFSVILYLNDTLVTQSGNNYSYRSYLETLLSFGKDAKDSQLSSVLWYQNTAGAFKTLGANNTGYTTRKAFAMQSDEIDMLGRLHLDMNFQSRYLLNGIEIKYRLIRSKDSFCFHKNPNQPKNKVWLKKVSLFCPKSETKPIISATTRQGFTTWYRKILFKACRSKSIHHPTRKPLFFKRKFVFGTTTHLSRGQIC